MENKEPTPDGDKERARREDELRAILLWDETVRRVIELMDMEEKHPELLRPIARQTFFWPGLIGRERWFNTENAKRMKRSS